MITLKPTGGLCNRLMVIDSGLSMCADLKIDLKIHWVKNYYLNASFFDLFQPIDIQPIKLSFYETDKKLLLYSDRELNKPKQRIYNFFLKRYQSLYFDKILHGNDVKSLIKKQYDFRQLSKYDRVLITSWARFIEKKISADYFQPVPPIQNSIDKLSERFSTHTIGIHIRRGDHNWSINKSPTSLFIQKMSEELKKNKETTFFLASDSEEEKESLIKEFGSRIIVNDLKSGDRNSTAGMQAAVVDLFCLSRTRKIYGSFYSTFSLVASELGKIQFEEINSENNAI